MPQEITKTFFVTSHGEEFPTFFEAMKREVLDVLDEGGPYISMYDRTRLAEYLLEHFEMKLRPSAAQTTEDQDSYDPSVETCDGGAA